MTDRPRAGDLGACDPALSTPACAGVHVSLFAPTPADAAEFAAAASVSRSLHWPWVVWPPSTEDEYLRYLDRVEGPGHRGYLVRVVDDGRLAGVVNVNAITYGVSWSASLGYYAFAGAERRGFMSEAVGLVVDLAFDPDGPLRLHRIEVNIQPDNLASKRLARRVGFRLEGFSPRLIVVAGAWRDHERWAVDRQEWSARR